MHPPEHEAKELRAGETLLDGFLIGLGAEHVAASDEARVDRGTDRSATGAYEPSRVTRSCVSSGVSKPTPSAPMPSRAASMTVSERDEATHTVGAASAAAWE